VTPVTDQRPESQDIEQLGINVIRGLAMDAPAKANSGHQGTAMALAPLAHVLFTRVMNYDAADPEWFDRDRFVLSAGHASILQYSLLHLTGVSLTLDDLVSFRQWGSETPGHPEAHTPGVEVTTGPLGQGFANGVGMAIAERHLRAVHGADVCDHFTYVVAGDGCLSEGVSHEAASLAGHLGLGRLVVVYDDNHITIDGATDLALSDDAAMRFRSYGWDVDEIGAVANDLDAIEAAILRAKAVTDQPTLIVLRSHIGYPSPDHTDDHEAHGLAFDAADITRAKDVMGLPDEPFHIPGEVADYYRQTGRRGAAARAEWERRNPDGVPAVMLDGWADALPTFSVDDSIATRKASQAAVSALSDVVPGLIGGSADLTGNTGTKIGDGSPHTAANPEGRQIYFGVREHAMGAALVGAAKHGGVIPIGGTFLVFADYMRPAIRMAAISGAKCVFVYTHDSVGVGEDGPTHQPVEQVMSLRAIPHLQVIRPGDATETAGAWKLALETDGPTALILSRQNLPVLADTSADSVARGAYVVRDVDDPGAVLIGTGSELALCLDAAAALGEQGVPTRVVSMPCWNAFEALPLDEQDDVLPPEVPTVSVEAGVPLGWDRHADLAVGIDRFGASAPGATVLRELGMNIDNVVSAVNDLLDAVTD
jgi:transketolase